MMVPSGFDSDTTTVETTAATPVAVGPAVSPPQNGLKIEIARYMALALIACIVVHGGIAYYCATTSVASVAAEGVIPRAFPFYSLMEQALDALKVLEVGLSTGIFALLRN